MVFRVRDNIWRIYFVNPNSRQLLTSSGDRVLGVCDNNTKTIYIADNQSDSKTEHIICHEITHSICFEYSISLDYKFEEFLCNFMADHCREVVSILDTILNAVLINVA